MNMDKARGQKTRGPRVTAAILALFLLVCLVESATEQRINSRGSKSNVIEKINGWRSQRGGSCTFYGHSCWGAHGKRSGQAATAPDWYLTRMLRRMAVNAEMGHVRQLRSTKDLSDIFQVEMPDEAPATEKLLTENQDIPVETGPMSLEAKPMLDNDLLSKIKIWQLMREASEDN